MARKHKPEDIIGKLHETEIVSRLQMRAGGSVLLNRVIIADIKNTAV